MDFLQRNLFTQLRADNFGTKEKMEPMTTFKRNRIAWMMKNVNDMPAGEVEMTNPLLNNRLKKIQTDERHAIDTNIETIYLLRIIVSNANGMIQSGVSIRGIIQLGNYLRTRGDKVDFVKLENWLHSLHLMRMAQLQGSILILFFNFQADEIPFVSRLERGGYKLTMRSLYFDKEDLKDVEFHQTSTGFVRASNGSMGKKLAQTMRFFEYAPIEAISNFLHNFAHSLSQIEE